MAKKSKGEGIGVGPGALVDSEYKPRAHVSWPAKGIRLSGNHQGIGMGKRAKITVHGTVKGYSMHDHGCSVDMDCDTIHVGEVDTSSAPVGKPMTDMIGRKRKD